MTKDKVARATGAHISIVAHITQFELDRELSECEFFNGFGNRFLWPVVERAQSLPDGGNLDQSTFEEYADKLTNALCNAAKIGEMCRDKEAQALWRSVYGDLTPDTPGLFGAITSRGAPQVLCISMILALSDGSCSINAQHLRAALALWNYCLESARFLWTTVVQRRGGPDSSGIETPSGRDVQEANVG